MRPLERNGMLVRYSADGSSHGEASATAKLTKYATTKKHHHHRIATITITTLAIRRHILLTVVTDDNALLIRIYTLAFPREHARTG